MSSYVHIICLIIVVLCTKFQDSLNEASTRAEVETKLNCTSDWQKLQVNWKSEVEESPVTQNFSSFWNHKEEYFKNQTVDKLLQTVIYPHNFTKNFWCYGNVAKSFNSIQSWLHNVSFNITLAKIGSELVGMRFLYQQKYKQRLEFYIRPRHNINKVNYSLRYCGETGSTGYICPRFGNVNFSCFQRNKDVYGIPSSAGLICQAFAPNIIFYRNYMFYFQSMKRDGSSSISTHFRIFVKQSDDDSTRPNGRGYFTAVLMAQKCRYLLATTTDEVYL